MNRNRDDILAMIENNRQTLRNMGVRKLGLFGSGARDEMKKKSDLDFIIELEIKTFDNYMDVKLFLEELFHCTVDLVLSNVIKPRIRESILRETVYAQGL